MRRWLRWGWWLGLLVAPVLGLSWELVTARPAAAASCPAPTLAFGRGEWCGYFSDQLDQDGGNVLTGSPAIPNAVNSAATFINFIQSRLSSGNAQDVTGA